MQASETSDRTKPVGLIEHLEHYNWLTVMGSISWYLAIIYPQLKENNTNSITSVTRIMLLRWALTNFDIFAMISIYKFNL